MVIGDCIADYVTDHAELAEALGPIGHGLLAASGYLESLEQLAGGRAISVTDLAAMLTDPPAGGEGQ